MAKDFLVLGCEMECRSFLGRQNDVNLFVDLYDPNVEDHLDLNRVEKGAGYESVDGIPPPCPFLNNPSPGEEETTTRHPHLS